MVIVCDTENPSLRAASCCKVDVVKGTDGDFLNGLVCTSSIVNVASLHCVRKASASAFSLKRVPSSAFISMALPLASGTKKVATTRYAASGWNVCISRSRSTIRRTATDCTRPAESEGLIFFQRMGDSLKPTMRSSTRRAC